MDNNTNEISLTKDIHWRIVKKGVIFIIITIVIVFLMNLKVESGNFGLIYFYILSMLVFMFYNLFIHFLYYKNDKYLSLKIYEGNLIEIKSPFYKYLVNQQHIENIELHARGKIINDPDLFKRKSDNYYLKFIFKDGSIIFVSSLLIAKEPFKIEGIEITKISTTFPFF